MADPEKNEERADSDGASYAQHNYHLYLPPNSSGKKETEDVEAIKSLFNIGLQIRNFEITQLVQRNNFFMIFQGVLFAGLVQSSHTKPVVSFMVCITGFVVALFQVGMASGAKFWQEYWEAVLGKIEEILIHNIKAETNNRRTLIQLFHSDADQYQRIVKNSLGTKATGIAGRLILCRFSASRIPIYVGLSLAVVWFVLILCTMRTYPPLGVPSFILGF